MRELRHIGGIPSPGQAPDVWVGEEDLSAVLYTGWDDQYFYFALDVEDSQIFPYDKGADFWKGDCLVIGIDPSGDGGYFQRGDDQLRRLLEAVQRLVRMQAEVVLELRRDLRKHLDVRAGGEELVAGAAEHDDVDVVVHTRIQDARIELLVHFIGVGVSRGVVQLEDCDAFFHPVVDEISSHVVSCSVNAARIVCQPQKVPLSSGSARSWHPSCSALTCQPPRLPNLEENKK